MKILLYFVQLVMLLGLCVSLTTCTFDEVCPPEEDQEIVNYINWIASFGDKYKLTKYVINGVDRTSYLDTLGIRNRVIDFTDFNKFRERSKRPTTKPDTKCLVVTGYGGISGRDTTWVAMPNQFEEKYLVVSLVKDNDYGLNFGFTKSTYQGGSRTSQFYLVPNSGGNLITYLRGDVVQTSTSVVLSTMPNSTPDLSLTFSLR